ncbi:hypothetical protein LINGRAHAP2_LOCUS23153 [Linum grandiflorum]
MVSDASNSYQHRRQLPNPSITSANSLLLAQPATTQRTPPSICSSSRCCNCSMCIIVTSFIDEVLSCVIREVLVATVIITSLFSS